MGRFRVSVDTGGTFTDFVLLDEETREIGIAKILSSPHDPSVSVIEGVSSFLAEDGSRAISYFCHGTTVGTNALLEEKGVRTGLLVTEGFRGIYEIMEQARPHGPALFDLEYDKPALLAPESRTSEVVGRFDHQGSELIALDEESVRSALDRLADEEVESIAVCLLFSYLRPEHERRVREIIAEKLPAVAVSLSSDVLPQIREYPRLSTTVINAYLQPIVARYLANLRGRLTELGVTTPQTYVMQSNGGTSTFEKAGEKAAATLLSGPAGGVTAGARLSRLTGIDKVITFDMGGTSCDVALIEGAQPGLSTGGVISGRHVALPALDIDTVSAGGGTLASVDAQGVLNVGPDSAGSVPGPACYSRGGTRPTVTDANLVLGYLGSSRLGGDFGLDVGRARAAVGVEVADRLGLDVVEAAKGIVDVVNIQMEEAIRGISTARGYDLRDFVLIGFGGAGPVHAAAMAQDLHMAGVLIPAHPGVLSALGLLMADVRHDHVRSHLAELSVLDVATVTSIVEDLSAAARAELEEEGFTEATIELDPSLDMRYRGQGYELRVPVTMAMLQESGFGAVRKAFDVEHQERFGHSAPDEPVEVVSYRMTGRGVVPEVRLVEHQATGRAVQDAVVGNRPARFAEDMVDTPVYARELLDVGHEFEGPAIVDQKDTTVVVLPGQKALVDAYLNILITSVQQQEAR